MGSAAVARQAAWWRQGRQHSSGEVGSTAGSAAVVRQAAQQWRGRQYSGQCSGSEAGSVVAARQAAAQCGTTQPPDSNHTYINFIMCNTLA